MKGTVETSRHLQYIDDKNTYYEMFTCAPDGLPIGLTSHCELILDQIYGLLDDTQRGILFSYDAFSKSCIPYIDQVQNLYQKYERIHWYDISEREASVNYDVIVLFGTFERIVEELPLLWKRHIENGSTPVVFYTSRAYRGFKAVDFDEIVARIRPDASGESESSFGAVDEVSQDTMPRVESPMSTPPIDDVALRKKIMRLKRAEMSIRKIAAKLGIKKAKVEWLLKRKPSQL